MKLTSRALYAAVCVALALAATRTAQAQTDSAFAITKAGANLLRLDTDVSLLVGGTKDVGTIPASGAGVRMMWFPARYAFRAGSVAANEWDAGNIGSQS